MAQRPGWKVGVFGVGGECSVLYSCAGEKGLDHALQRVEVAVAEEADYDLAALVGELCRVFVRDIDLRKLREGGLFGVVVVVAREDLEHRRDGGGAHDAGVFAERVRDDDGFSLGALSARFILS